MKKTKAELLKWFDNNYIENVSQIEFLLEEMEKYHKITMYQLLDACKELRKVFTDEALLETHILIMTKLTDVGIDSHIAGIKLKEAFLLSKIKQANESFN